jgi:hypothetical protein
MDAADVMTLDEAASTDLIETPAEHPVYDPGTLENEPGSKPEPRSDLTLDQAVQQYADDDGKAVQRAKERPAVVLGDQPLTLSQLVNGYVAGVNLQDAVHGLDTRYAQVIDAARDVAHGAMALAEYLTAQLPTEPKPELSIINPGEFVRQKAAYDEGHKIIQNVLQTAELARQQAAAAATQQRVDMLKIENRRLVECFPECAEPEGREQFFDRVREVAYACDFTENELRQVADHRMFRLAYLAMAGLEKRQAGQDRRHKKPQSKKKPSTDAMEQLSASGSIDDAMAVDFD